MPFDIVVHAEQRVLEVIYPAAPSTEEISDYSARVRQAINGMGESWGALVDQRQLLALPQTLMSALAMLNAYAQLKGMRRSARIVADAASGLKAWRLTQQARLVIPARTFESREEALAWLREP